MRELRREGGTGGRGGSEWRALGREGGMKGREGGGREGRGEGE